ncbi:hypothetical protein Tco_0254990 [Tanacetum coccineum]
MTAKPRRLWCGLGGDGSGGDAAAVVVRVASMVDHGEVVGAGGLAGEVVTRVMLMVAWRGDDGVVEVTRWQRGGDDDLGGGGWLESVPLIPTFIASEGSLIVSSSRTPTVSCQVTDPIAVCALYSARAIVVKLALVIQW